MSEAKLTDLILRLSHDVAVLLELYVEDDEVLRELWAETNEALVDASQHLVSKGLLVPDPIENITMRFIEGWSPKSPTA